MILKINEENKIFVESLRTMFEKNPDVRIFNNELIALANSKIDSVLNLIDVSADDIDEDTKKYAINVLYEYLLNDEAAINYDGMINTVREAIRECKEKK